MPVVRQITIPSVLERIPEGCQCVVEEAEAAGLDERAVYHCQMAVDEWCTNVVEHGCCDDETGEQHQIAVECRERGDQFVITVVDNGIRFDPTTLADVDPARPLDEREPGGLGWFFIRRLMDEVSYEFKEGRNHLTMVKNGAHRQSATDQPDDSAVQARELSEGLWIVIPVGRLDSTASRTLETALNAQLDAGHARLVIDMNQVVYISSSGLRVLVSIWRRAQKLGGNIALATLSPRVREVFSISGFDTLFTIAQSVEDAAASLSPAASRKSRS
jgi:serine/threonine-protein kinase RsbW